MAAEPVLKRPRGADADAASTAAWTLTLDDWMKAWQPGGADAGDRDRDHDLAAAPTAGLAAADKEFAELERADKEAREERRRLEVTEAIAALSSVLSPLVDAAEAAVAEAAARRVPVDAVTDDSYEQVAPVLAAFDEAHTAAAAALRRCGDYFASERFARLETAPDDARQEAEQLRRRFSDAESRLASAADVVRSKMSSARARRDEAARQVEAQRAAEEQDRLFARYDRDGDGLLNVTEVAAFVRRECNAELPQEKLQALLRGEPFASAGGVARADFARLRMLVGIATVGAALDGVEGEVVKAEAKARPLSARGPAAVPLDRLEDATEDLDVAVDAAGDYLAAARAQAHGISLGNDELSVVASANAQEETPETVALRSRLESLEKRLGEAAAVAKKCHERMELQRRKAALLAGLSRR
eukprot:TRINITY_DN930_c1_g4_i1.p1 TRINITY_DN930_c1_g4~~TRINITY_DN930_c1_g4_i1.p1  ORF type:complete len:446 (+),score=128.83 TRINITY_DN930_c1_g4_i1:90-1340(+)